MTAIPSTSDVTVTEGNNSTLCFDAGGAVLSPLNALQTNTNPGMYLFCTYHNQYIILVGNNIFFPQINFQPLEGRKSG